MEYSVLQFVELQDFTVVPGQYTTVTTTLFSPLFLVPQLQQELLLTSGTLIFKLVDLVSLLLIIQVELLQMGYFSGN